MKRKTRALRMISASALAAVLGVTTACSGGASSWKGGTPASPAGPKASVTITTPQADRKDVPASAEIEFTAKEATSTTVELTDADGTAVEGELRSGGTTWVPAQALDYGTTYTAKVSATGDDGRTATATSTFTTMPRPANTVRVSTNIGDGNVVGVGMPMVVRFGRAVPEDRRDDVERRLWVTTSPAQEGAWHWFSGQELHYRPRELWQAGTKLDFRIGTGGLPLGGDWFGRTDLTVDAAVRPDALVMTVDNATKRMTVTHNGRAVRTIPVSLGKPATPSSSGAMVVMERLRNTIFDTTSDPNPANRYKIPIEYALRLTWGGEFVHAAPWSVQHQGVRNVSHGCVNMNMQNAAWLFNLTKLGDPVTVKGTERTINKGNGWTDWSMSWSDYLAGSALPRPPAEPSPTPSN